MDDEVKWALEEDFVEVVIKLPTMELQVLLAVAQGLQKGLEVYGPLDLVTDKRDFNQEAFEEQRDLLIYRTIQIMRTQK